MSDGSTFFIGNAWAAPLRPGLPLQAFDPATGSLPRPTAAGGLADADRAVAAAHAAQPVGENLPAAQRATVCAASGSSCGTGPCRCPSRARRQTRLQHEREHTALACAERCAQDL